jgi:predicted DsbA family dithiol-disulfide isomerase
VRLRRLEEEFGDALCIDRKSFLLRPRPDPTRTLEKFRAYTQSWLRAAADPEGGEFRVWESDAGPPSHSIPPHLVAKAAATFGAEAFRRMEERLFHAYFAENRDITDLETLRALWHEAGLPADAIARAGDRALLDAVIAEHNEAVAAGVDGVPAVRMVGREGMVLGAQPLAVYRRWIERALAAPPE